MGLQGNSSSCLGLLHLSLNIPLGIFCLHSVSKDANVTECHHAPQVCQQVVLEKTVPTMGWDSDLALAAGVAAPALLTGCSWAVALPFSLCCRKRGF